VCLRIPDLKLVRNDTNFYIEFVVKDAEGNIVNLENSTVIFKMQSYSGGSLVANIAGEVPVGSDGICKFLITDELDNLIGEFQAEIQITYSGGRIITAPDISVRVIPDLPT